MDNQQQASPSPTSPPPAAPVQRRPHHVWRWVAGTLGALTLLLAAGVAWLWHSDAGTAQLLARVPGLSMSGQRGRLTGGAFSIERLVWQSSTLRVEVQGLSWRNAEWRARPHAGAWVALALDQPRAQRVTVTTSPATEPQPKSKPPQDLKLPLEVVAPAFQIDTLQVGSGAPITGLRADLHVGAGQGGEHRVERLVLERAGVAVRGELRIGAAAPMRLQGVIGAAVAPSAAHPWRAGARLGGTLPAVAIDAQLQAGRDATAQARASLLPFAPWPLASMEARWQGVDLSAFAPGLPKTRLGGEVHTVGEGLQAGGTAGTTTLQLAVRNAEPGPWDAARLPVHSVAARLTGRPGSDVPVALDDMVIELAGAHKAGRVTGHARWDVRQLQLVAELQGVQPAQVLTSAPPLKIGGPLQFTLRGLAAPGQPPASGAQAGRLQGQWQARLEGELDRPHSPPVQLQSEGSFEHRPDGALTLVLDRLAATGGGGAQASARAERSAGGTWHVVSKGDLQRFDPGVWWPAADGGRAGSALSARWQADIQWLATVAGPFLSAVRGRADVAIEPSRLAGVPLQGEGRLNATAEGATLQGRLQAARNTLRLDGRFGGNTPQWQAEVKAPELAALAPLQALMPETAGRWFPRGGVLQGEARVAGSGTALRTQGRLNVDGLRSPALTLAQARAQWQLEGRAPNDPVLLQLQAGGIELGTQRVDRLDARLQGSLASHTFTLDAASPLRPPEWVLAAAQANAPGAAVPAGSALHLALQGHWQPAAEGGRWQGTVQSLQAAPRRGGAPWLAAQGLQGQVQFDAAGQPVQASLAPGRVALFAGGVRWRQARWQAPAAAGQLPRIALDAQVEPLQVAPLLARLQPQFGWQGDLALGGHAVVDSSNGLNADVAIERVRGDLAMQFQGVQRTLGLSALRVALLADRGRWRVSERVEGRNVGLLQGEQSTQAEAGGLLPSAAGPLAGNIEARVPDLAVWTPWLPAGWSVAGQLQATASLAGRVGAPQVSGRVGGQQLAIDNLFQGVHLRDGQVAVALQGDRATVERFVFHGNGDGTLQVTGAARFGDAPSANLHATAQRFRVLDRVDRRVVVSGSADAGFQAQRLAVNGRFRVDEGLVDVSQSDAQQLGDDVVVVNLPPGAPSPFAKRGGAATSASGTSAAKGGSASAPADIDVAVDLGDALRLRGRGIDTGLKGQLRVTTPKGQLAVNGVVRVDGGTYTAYNQNLLIERGTLVFTGDVASPRLDLLAVRPDLDMRVGVQAIGRATDPRVKLYSDAGLSDMDTLTWLVLGRAPEGLGRDDTALLQRAALALYAGDKNSSNKGIVQKLGLDELSLHRGSGDAEGTIVSLGKQLSKRLFVGYERALATAGGTWQLIYRVFGRMTLRARTGDEESVDAVWTWAWE